MAVVRSILGLFCQAIRYVAVMGGVVLSLSGCMIDSACYNDADCPDDQRCKFASGEKKGTCEKLCTRDADCPNNDKCDTVTGQCWTPDCRRDSDCNEGFTCNEGKCESMAQLQCPDGMTAIGRSFCIDIYEASRSDATETSIGQDDSVATSRKGVLPWLVPDNATAEAACRAAEKELCTEEQWHLACIGPEETVYAYGNEYDPTICNGIDTFCRCEESGCSDKSTCPYAYCYSDCGADFKPVPTGQFSDCTNGYGIFDINGNLWEHVRGGDDTRIRGGAFNCKDSKQLHRCDYIPGNWTPSAPGFRCCAPGWVDLDGGVGNGDTE